MSRCKSCCSEDKRERRARDGDLVRAKERASNAGRRDAKNAQSRDWYRRNPGHSKANNRKWRTENDERYREYHADYYRANTTRIRARAEAWRLAHPVEARAQRRLANARRRARIQGLPYEKFTLLDVWERDSRGGLFVVCYLCSKPVDFEGSNIDHLIPIAARPDDLAQHGIDNPGTVLANAAVTHASCNKSKSRKLPPGAVAMYLRLSTNDPAA